LSCVYDFNQVSERVRWLRSAFKPHANAMLDRWQEQDRLKIGSEAAKINRKELIRMAENVSD
jgi:hypothetical protein